MGDFSLINRLFTKLIEFTNLAELLLNRPNLKMTYLQNLDFLQIIVSDRWPFILYKSDRLWVYWSRLKNSRLRGLGFQILALLQNAGHYFAPEVTRLTLKKTKKD